MRFKYISEEGITEVLAGKDDICLMCKLFDYCPLLGALEINLVYPAADKLTIKDCPIYDPEDISE